MTSKSFLFGDTKPWSRAARPILVIFALISIVVFECSLVSAVDIVKKLDYKTVGDATRMLIAMHFARESGLKWLLLQGPLRPVIDLHNSKLTFDTKNLKLWGLIRSLRYDASGAGTYRLVVTSNGPLNFEKVDVIENYDGMGYCMLDDIAMASGCKFVSALAIQSDLTISTMSTPKIDSVGKVSIRDNHPFTIVIDPGHGGIDGGAEGTNGTVEKIVTLAFAKELKTKLDDGGKYKVVLTRECDEFLRVDDRVRIARQHEADLFISIHVDTIGLKDIRGATVYTLSDKASDAEAQALADRENLSDQLAGVDLVEENHEISDILVDLIRRETYGFSTRFARSLVGELSPTVGMINNPHRSAGFRVLKAPDLPSVLVELGYLSNAKDEELLQSDEWRDKAAASIAKAVTAFVAERGALSSR